MKPLLILPACLSLLGSVAALAQDKEKRLVTADNSSIFDQGRNRFTFNSKMSLRVFDVIRNDMNVGKSTDFRFQGEYSRFVIDGFAVGGQVNVDLSKDKLGNFIHNTTVIRGGVHALYGRSLGGAVNIYTKAAYDIGTYKESNSVDYTQSYSGYSLDVGMPIELENSIHVTLTPYVQYMHGVYKDDDYKEIVNQITVGARFETYPRCGQLGCDHRVGYAYSSANYDKGSQFINYISRGSVSFGKWKDDPQTYEEKFTEGGLNLVWGYYFADNIAGGLGVNFDTYKQKPEGGGEYSGTSVELMGLVRAHPFKKGLRNLFFQGSYEIGGQTDKSDFGSVSNETKYSTSGYAIEAGYNLYMNRSLSITGFLGWRSSTTKLKESDDKDTNRGVRTRWGLNYSF